MSSRLLLATAAGLAGFALELDAQILITRTFTLNTPVPDFGELASAPVLNLGGGTVQNVQVGLTLTSGTTGGPMFNGDIYASLGHGTGFAVLLNRPGRTAANSFGYSDAGMTVTFADNAANGDVHNYQTALGGAPAGGVLTGTWAPDGRNANPSTVTDATARTAMLSSFNGLASDGEWRLLVSDESGGAVAEVVSWTLKLVVQPDALQQMSLSDTEFAPNAGPQTLANPLQFTGTNTISGNYDVTLQGALTGSGTLTKQDNGTLTLLNPDGFAGALAVAGGTLALPSGFGGSGGSLSVGASASIAGSGTISRALANQGSVSGPALGSGQFLTFSGGVTGAGNYSGRIAMAGSFSPGNSPASVTFHGDLTLGSANLLTMEIGGLVPGTGFDQLLVSDTIAFGGTLQVTLINGFTPSAGNSFQLFSAGTYASAFDAQQFATLPGSLVWDASQLTSTGVLSVTAIPEPATFAIWSAALALGATLWRRRKNQRS